MKILRSSPLPSSEPVPLPASLLLPPAFDDPELQPSTPTVSPIASTDPAIARQATDLLVVIFTVLPCIVCDHFVWCEAGRLIGERKPAVAGGADDLRTIESGGVRLRSALSSWAPACLWR
jgi:hypothetical protein